MRKLTLNSILLVTTLLLGAAVPWAHAGDWFCDTAPCPGEFDWQWFAPIQDVCCEENPKAREGYFGSVELAHTWILRPDRAAIGNANQAVVAWLPNSVNYVLTSIPSTTLGNGLMGGNAGSFLFPIVSGGAFGFQFNGIDDAYTKTADGNGHRYEFGRINDDCGWMVSILDSLHMGTSDLYGFDDKRLNQLGAAQGLSGIDGIPDPDGIGPIGVTQPVAPVAGSPSIIAVDGLLTVPVLFDDPFGLLQGFTDNDFNQLPDNANLVRIAVVFDDLMVSHRAELVGVETVAVRRKRRLHSGFDVEGYIGARYLELDDRFSVLARGGALADTSWNNRAQNRIVGPEFGFRATRQKRQWITTIQAKFLAGANFLSVRQDGTIADHLTIGAPGVPEAFGGNTFFHRLGDERFSPVGEFRFETACQLTRTHQRSRWLDWNGDWQRCSSQQHGRLSIAESGN